MLNPIETERLILRPLVAEDVHRLFLLDSNPQVMKYVGQPVLTEPSQSRAVIEMIQAQYEKFGIGRFAVIEKESNLLIGWAGLKFVDYEVNGHQDFYEIGYRFLPEFWGKGYATESNKPFVGRAFNEMGVKELFAYAHEGNAGSHHVLQKLGFEIQGDFMESDGRCIWFVHQNNSK